MIRETIPPDLWEKLEPLAIEQRREPTPAENLLWQHIRDRQLARMKFRRQHVIVRFIVDFACLRPKRAIEVDGPIHDFTPEYDALRTECLEAMHYRVLRITNDEIFNDLNGVLASITAFAKR